MTPTKQRHEHWCLHACLESVCLDRQSPWTQEIIQETFSPFFPEPDRVFQTRMIPMVAFSMGLANTFKVGRGYDFILSNYVNIDPQKGFILIVTQKTPEGGAWGHCFRLSGLFEGGLLLQNVSPDEDDTIAEFSNFLTAHDCLIYVCILLEDNEQNLKAPSSQS